MHHQQPDPRQPVRGTAVEQAHDPDEPPLGVAGEQDRTAAGTGLLPQIRLDPLGVDVLGIVLAGRPPVGRVGRVDLDDLGDLPGGQAQRRQRENGHAGQGGQAARPGHPGPSRCVGQPST
ncbi:hypothetical protein [Actinacidiphila acididurans]|uniref:hypothetical protein n=1 Tax=Actinacidiphila acididurans TaxID=2784346 RepID=UPI0027DBA5A4|nr:hypothetical protein [Actinacidiphila acididurans]